MIKRSNKLILSLIVLLGGLGSLAGGAPSITSIADGHRRSGLLTIGYGASADKLGPELGFGLSLEPNLDAPILLIKTSWGGKSLHYDFRPPSAGPYELNDAE